VTDSKRTAKRLKQLREMAGLTQFDVASFLDCDRSLVSMIENGYHTLSQQDTEKLLTHLEQKARRRFDSVFAADGAVPVMATA
jgi:transcriptional regulator with XRE-family HTH domain